MNKCPGCRIKNKDCMNCLQVAVCQRQFDTCSSKRKISKLKCKNGECDKTEICLCYESFILIETNTEEESKEINNNSNYLEIIKIIESQ